MLAIKFLMNKVDYIKPKKTHKDNSPPVVTIYSRYSM